MTRIELSPHEDTKEDFDKIVAALWAEAVARDWEADFRTIMSNAGASQYIESKCQLSATLKFRVPGAVLQTAHGSLNEIFGEQSDEHVTRHMSVALPPKAGTEPDACVCPDGEWAAIQLVKDWANAKFDEHVWPGGYRVNRVDTVTNVEYKCDREGCRN